MRKRVRERERERDIAGGLGGGRFWLRPKLCSNVWQLRAVAMRRFQCSRGAARAREHVWQLRAAEHGGSGAGAAEGSHTSQSRSTVLVSKEHTHSIAFCNVGVLESALTGQRSEKHLEDIGRQVEELLRDHAVLGICFCEMGQPGKGLTQGSRARVEATIQGAWRRAGAAEHGLAQVYWGGSDEALLCCFRCRAPQLDGSTGAAEHGVVPKSLRVEVASNRLVSDLDSIEKWRCAQVLEVHLVDDVASGEGESLTVINCHLASGKKPLTDRSREECLGNLMNLGCKGAAGGRFLLGGDLDTARATLVKFTKRFTQPQPMLAFANQAKKQKPGDIVVGYGLELLQENNNVKNRDAAHDCIVGTWKRTCGAEEHTAGGVNQPSSCSGAEQRPDSSVSAMSWVHLGQQEARTSWAEQAVSQPRVAAEHVLAPTHAVGAWAEHAPAPTHTPAVDAVAGQAMEQSDWAPTRETLAAAPPPRVAAEHGLAPTHAVWASDGPGLPSGPHASALPRVAAEHVLAPTHAVEHERRAFVDLAEEEATRNRQ